MDRGREGRGGKREGGTRLLIYLHQEGPYHLDGLSNHSQAQRSLLAVSCDPSGPAHQGKDTICIRRRHHCLCLGWARLMILVSQGDCRLSE